MDIFEFACGTERKINPMDVGKVHYMQTRLKKLPTFLQRKIVISATKKSDKMGFVVEPYAFFLFFEIEDLEKVKKLLPEGFEPVKASVFDGDPEKYYGITSIFRVHTSVFWGARTEFYLVAKNIKTGLMSWIILDYASDTISYDHKHGLRSPDAEKVIVTTTCEGEFLAEVKNTTDHRRLACRANLKNAKMRNLNKRLWIEGNTSIAYGKELSSEGGDLFSLTFMPREMKEALEVPLKDVNVEQFSWFPEVIGGKLIHAACFPYAQHMLSDNPGACTHYGSKEALEKAAEKVKF